MHAYIALPFSTIKVSHVLVKSAPANFSFSLLIPLTTGTANSDLYVSAYTSNILNTKSELSFSSICAVCPSYHKNSLVLIKGVGCLNSHLTILVH